MEGKCSYCGDPNVLLDRLGNREIWGCLRCHTGYVRFIQGGVDKPIVESKYGNKITLVDGQKFDSKREAERYQDLLILERQGKIENLRRQVDYEILPKQIDEKPVVYRADFVYEEDGHTIVEDAKGMRTKEYIIKRKLMLFRYGIRIRET